MNDFLKLLFAPFVGIICFKIYEALSPISELLGFIVIVIVIIFVCFLGLVYADILNFRFFSVELEEPLKKDSKSVSEYGKNSKDYPSVRKTPLAKQLPNIPEYDTHSVMKSKWVSKQIEYFKTTQSLIDLLKVEPVDKIRYVDLLDCVEWKCKRLRTLMRDGFTCRDCGFRSNSNHVHHNRYQKDKLPWDIDVYYLHTLCYKCHELRHKKEKIPVFEKVGEEWLEVKQNFSVCNRCNGSGYLPQFNYHLGGICFKCNGDYIDRSIFKKVLNEIQQDNYQYKFYVQAMRFDIAKDLNEISDHFFKSRIYVSSEPDKYDSMPF